MKAALWEMARLDASAMAWTGALDASWSRASGEPQPEVWASLEKKTRVVGGFHGAAEELSVLASKVEAGDGKKTLTVTVGVQRSDSPRMVGKVVEVELRLEAQAQNFGGRRWWFRCGVCGSRRAHVYALPACVPAPWRCRECVEGKYESSSCYGRSSRHGDGWGAKLYRMDQGLKQNARRARRSYRRRLHRERQRAAAA